MLQHFLTLGDIVTFVGLIIAVISFAKPRHILIWKLSSNLIKVTLLFLLIAGYFSPLVSLLLPDSSNVWDNLSLSQTVQIIGFVAITLGLLVLIYIYSRLNYRHLTTNSTRYKFRISKFPKKKWNYFNFQVERRKFTTTRSAKKFYEVTSVFLARGNIEEVVEVTRMNLKSLVHTAHQYNPERFPFPGETEREPRKTNGSNYSYETLYQLLTDQAVMKHICTSNRFFLHAIVGAEIDDNDGSGRSELSSILYSNILEHLVINTDSFLYTQKEAHYGTARFANVYNLLTDEKIIRRQSIFPPMLTWTVSKADIPLDEYTSVMLKLLERMVESYKRQPGNTELLANIRIAFDQLIGDDGVTRKLAFDEKARKQYVDENIKSMGFKVLSKISLSMTTELLFKNDDPDTFKNNDNEINAENTSQTYDQTTLTGLLAHKIYDLIEDLTIFYQDTDNPDGELFREVNSYISLFTDTAVAKRYKELLWEMLFDKAVGGKTEEFFTNIAGYVPNILRFVVKYLVPFSDYTIKNEPQAAARLKSIMSKELKDAILAKTMVRSTQIPIQDELLPSNVTVKIDYKNNTVSYYYTGRNGKKSLIDLSLPGEAKQKIKKSTKTK